MKGFFAIFLSLTCLMAVFCPVFAAETCTVPPVDGDGKYANMGDLYQAWGGYEGYPDYICGVWSNDGGMENLTVAVTGDEAGEQGKKEILSLLKDPASVTFTTQEYSYAQLRQVMEEIELQMGGDSPIIACGVYEMDNTVHVTLFENAENAEAVAGELVKAYGDRVAVELGQTVMTHTILKELGDEQEHGKTLMVILLGLLGLGGLTFAVKRPARVTADGKVVTGGKPSRAQVEAALAEQTETPPDRVEDRIRKQL